MFARSRTLLVTVAALAVFAVSASSSFANDPPRQYWPDGAWYAVATMPSGAEVPFMDIYTSNPRTAGRAGTVLCTLSLPASPAPYALTQGGHGNWVRVRKNVFAFTVIRILIIGDPSNPAFGAPVGAARFWGTITVTGADTFEGEMQAAYYLGAYEPGAVPFLVVPTFTTAGTRIAVGQN